MRWWLVPCLLVLGVAGLAPGRLPAAEPIFAPFDAAGLDADERRLVQAALAAAGDYDGLQDGIWGEASETALAAYAGREFGEAPVKAHAAALLLDFSERVDADGWRMAALPGLPASTPVAMALPEARLGPPEPEEGGLRRWGEGISLTLLTHDFGKSQAVSWHAAAETADAGAAGLRLRGPDLLVTAGRLDDGRRFFTRSDRAGDRWATVYLAAAAPDAAMLNLAAGSIRPGVPLPWALPEGGALERMVSEPPPMLKTWPDTAQSRLTR